MSLSPSPPPPETSAALAGSTTLTFKLPSRRSSTLLADGGLAELYKIFGVRASMSAARDGGDHVAVTLTGSNYYAELARHWVIARVAPEYAMKLRLSPAQVSLLALCPRPRAFLSPLHQLHSILGARLQSLAALQLHSCCYAAEFPRGSGNLLLQGGHQAVARAIQWVSNMASAKRLNISFDAGDAYPTGYHGSDTSPPRNLTPFHTHAIKLFPPSSPPSAVASSSQDSNCAGAASPATFGPSSPSCPPLHLTRCAPSFLTLSHVPVLISTSCQHLATRCPSPNCRCPSRDLLFARICPSASLWSVASRRCCSSKPCLQEQVADFVIPAVACAEGRTLAAEMPCANHHRRRKCRVGAMPLAAHPPCYQTSVFVCNSLVSSQAHGKGYFFSTRGLQLVYDWFVSCIIFLKQIIHSALPFCSILFFIMKKTFFTSHRNIFIIPSCFARQVRAPRARLHNRHT